MYKEIDLIHSIIITIQETEICYKVIVREIIIELIILPSTNN